MKIVCFVFAEYMCLFSGIPIGYSTPLTMADTSSKIMRGTKGDASVLKPSIITAVPVSTFENTVFFKLFQTLKIEEFIFIPLNYYCFKFAILAH